MSLLSVNMQDLMREIISSSSVDSSVETEDLSFLSNALDEAKKAKQFDMVCQFEMAIFHFRRAAKIIDNLYLIRKEKYPSY